MFFSLIVATVKRRKTLYRLLMSLKDQTYKNFEVIIVDQNSPGYLDEIIFQFMNYFTLSVISTNNVGVSSARNLGLDVARGDIVAFPDDDCWYMPNTLERVEQLFINNLNVDGIMVSWSEKLQSRQQRKLHLTDVTPYNAFTELGALVQFFRQDVVKSIKFDPLLGPGTDLPYGCGEDTDYLLQIIENKKRILRTNEVLVYHPFPDMNDPLLMQKTKKYAFGRMYLLQKHNFPLWFMLANILYPLVICIFEKPTFWRYRKAMFTWRLNAFLSEIIRIKKIN